MKLTLCTFLGIFFVSFMFNNLSFADTEIRVRPSAIKFLKSLVPKRVRHVKIGDKYVNEGGWTYEFIYAEDNNIITKYIVCEDVNKCRLAENGEDDEHVVINDNYELRNNVALSEQYVSK